MFAIVFVAPVFEYLKCTIIVAVIINLKSALLKTCRSNKLGKKLLNQIQAEREESFHYIFEKVKKNINKRRPVSQFLILVRQLGP